MVEGGDLTIVRRDKRGFSISEYAILTVAVILGLVAMMNLFTKFMIGRERFSIFSLFGSVTSDKVQVDIGKGKVTVH